MPVVRWTIDQISEIKRLAGEGHTAKAVGEMFGGTKNAMLGLAFRHGFSFHGPNSNQWRSKRCERVARARPAAPKLSLVWPLPVEREPEPVEPPPGTKTLMELGAAECHYIDVPHFYCGADTGDFRQPYCPYHRKIMFRKAPVISDAERQRRRRLGFANMTRHNEKRAAA